MHLDSSDFRQFRRALGFSSQSAARDFFGAKDIKPSLDFLYLESLNFRLSEMVDRAQAAVNEVVRLDDVDEFKKVQIVSTYTVLRESGYINQLNNLGRRREDVYFSWMRGSVMAQFFKVALGLIVGVEQSQISLIGGDDIRDMGTFRKSPTADLELPMNGRLCRFEMQTGFSGINDIKQHKVLEAKKVFRESSIQTFAFHIDIFNGQGAMVPLHSISDGDVNWISRQQFEGQTVLNIDQNLFTWNLLDDPPSFEFMLGGGTK
jgi:hypothetical protein